jgi:hypothetical protein
MFEDAYKGLGPNESILVVAAYKFLQGKPYFVASNTPEINAAFSELARAFGCETSPAIHGLLNTPGIHFKPGGRQ